MIHSYRLNPINDDLSTFLLGLSQGRFKEDPILNVLNPQRKQETLRNLKLLFFNSVR